MLSPILMSLDGLSWTTFYSFVRFASRILTRADDEDPGSIGDLVMRRRGELNALFFEVLGND